MATEGNTIPVSFSGVVLLVCAAGSVSWLTGINEHQPSERGFRNILQTERQMGKQFLAAPAF